mgnify:FL=1
MVETRRIKRALRQELDKKPLTDADKRFIMGCIKAQIKQPQLTNAQWRIVQEIRNKYE